MWGDGIALTGDKLQGTNSNLQRHEGMTDCAQLFKYLYYMAFLREGIISQDPETWTHPHVFCSSWCS